MFFLKNNRLKLSLVKLWRFNPHSSSFTLIELLIVIGILAVLMVAVVVAINPAEYLRKSRDAKRVTDITSIDKSIGILEALDAISSYGTANTVYVSLPDTSSTCANLGLPTLPTGYSYNCVIEANLKNTDGTGWIPLDFNSSGVVQLSTLPIDPTNSPLQVSITHILEVLMN